MEPWTDNEDSSQGSIMAQDDPMTSNIDEAKPQKLEKNDAKLNSDLNIVKSPRRV